MRALERLIDRASRYGEASRDAVRRPRRAEDDQRQLRPPRRRRGADPGRAICWPTGVRNSDVVARIGGDEFGILLAHSDEAKAARDGDAAGRPDRAAATSCTTAMRLPLSVAIGVAMITGERHARSESWTAPTRQCTGARPRLRAIQLRRDSSGARPTDRRRGRRRSACRSGSRGRRSRRRRCSTDI